MLDDIYNAKILELAQKLHSLLGGKFHGMRVRDRCGATMAASERAGLRHFPIHVQRRPSVVARPVTMGSSVMWLLCHTKCVSRTSDLNFALLKIVREVVKPSQAEPTLNSAV